MSKFLPFLGSKTFFKNLGWMALVACLILVVVTFWLRTTTKHGEFVMVPDLTGMEVQAMREALEQSGLRYEVVDSANYSPEFPRFSILGQTPAAGTEVKENRKIYVTINPSGYKKVSVPNIIQVTQRNASAMLRAVGLDVQKVTYIDELGKDMVYHIQFQGKEIFPGDKLPKTSRVELICGNGNIEKAVEEPVDSF
jgi:beta-lactam-binding protein with PASTA domain